MEKFVRGCLYLMLSLFVTTQSCVADNDIVSTSGKTSLRSWSRKTVDKGSVARLAYLDLAYGKATLAAALHEKRPRGLIRSFTWVCSPGHTGGLAGLLEKRPRRQSTPSVPADAIDETDLAQHLQKEVPISRQGLSTITVTAKSSKEEEVARFSTALAKHYSATCHAGRGMGAVMPRRQIGLAN